MSCITLVDFLIIQTMKLDSIPTLLHSNVIYRFKQNQSHNNFLTIMSTRMSYASIYDLDGLCRESILVETIYLLLSMFRILIIYIILACKISNLFEYQDNSNRAISLPNNQECCQTYRPQKIIPNWIFLSKFTHVYFLCLTSI
jgi:hypothetical protein